MQKGKKLFYSTGMADKKAMEAHAYNMRLQIRKLQAENKKLKGEK